MATVESLTAAVDQIVALFNARKMDLPDGVLDRKTQFVINGAPFETLLGQNPNDALILMLTRGPAGLRFTAKGLQHALPDARLERETAVAEVDPLRFTTRLRLSGRLRDSGETVDEIVEVTLRLTAAGLVETAEALMPAPTLSKIQRARRDDGGRTPKSSLREG